MLTLLAATVIFAIMLLFITLLAATLTLSRLSHCRRAFLQSPTSMLSRCVSCRAVQPFVLFPCQFTPSFLISFLLVSTLALSFPSFAALSTCSFVFWSFSIPNFPFLDIFICAESTRRVAASDLRLSACPFVMCFIKLVHFQYFRGGPCSPSAR